MSICVIEAKFKCDVKTVWEIVTSLDDYAWRSDLSKIEVVDENKFIEYTKDNFPTEFKITTKEAYKLYEFSLENSNIKGKWKGEFSYDNDYTTIIFTEDVNAKKFFLKPFVKPYLKSQQKKYVQDLKQIIENK